MFTVVAGGGKVGYHLSKALLNMGHEIVLIEKNRGKARTLSTDLGSIVHPHDACEGRWLLQAGVTRADLVVAVTGDDEDNLIICQLARTLSGEKARTIARINNPKNAIIFKRLGVDHTVSSTDLILSMIEQDIPTGAIVHLLRLDESDLELVEIRLPAESQAVSRTIGEVNLRGMGGNLCLIIRGTETLLPQTDLRLQSGDMLVALIHADMEAEVRQYLTEPEVVVRVR